MSGDDQRAHTPVMHGGVLESKAAVNLESYAGNYSGEVMSADDNMNDYNAFVLQVVALEKLDGAPTDGAFDQALCDAMLLHALKWAAENDGSLNAGFNALLDLMRERAVEFFPKFAEAA